MSPFEVLLLAWRLRRMGKTCDRLLRQAITLRDEPLMVATRDFIVRYGEFIRRKDAEISSMQRLRKLRARL